MPLRSTDARKLIRRLLTEGIFVISPQARDEMTKDNLSDQDALNVLRGGTVGEAERENVTGWRRN
jgi:hypothetical protein